MSIATARFLTSLYFIATLPGVFSYGVTFPEFPVSNSQIAKLVNELRDEDVNRLTDGQISLRYHKYLTNNDPGLDENYQHKFFPFVDRRSLQKDTYEKFIALSNHYEPELGIEEKYTPSKIRAIEDFIDAIFETKIWRMLYEFLHAKKHPYARGLRDFRKWIRQLWFEGYPRLSQKSQSPVIDSSGFEHVFLGERYGKNVSGLHSWIRFHLLERDKSQHFNYQGYTVGRYNVMSVVRFRWFDAVKPASSMLIGTSPEFDLAIYTLCFLARQLPTPCLFELDECPFIVQSQNDNRNNRISVRSSQLFAGKITDKCRERNKKQQ